MKFSITISISLLIFYGVLSKTRVVTHRLILTYQNKAIVDPLEIVNGHFNRTHKQGYIYTCYKVPITEEATIHIVVYTVIRNRPLHMGVEFNVGMCKVIQKNVFGARKMLAGSKLTQCPIKAECINSTLDLSQVEIPTGFRTGNYMLKYTIYLKEKMKIYGAEWWGEFKDVNE